MLPDLFARFAAMRSPWRTLVPPSVVFATKTAFNMLQCVNPGLCCFSPGADQMPIITTASLASSGRPAAPPLRPSPGPAKIPKASPSDGPPGPQNQQSLCGNYTFLCGNSYMGKGVGEHPQRTPQKALFKHASSSTVPSPVGFADTLVGAWPAEPVVKSPEAAFVGVHRAAAAAEKIGPRGGGR